ncbi:NADP-binding protein [Gigaspora margarita]|uniref:NADP-binding protein n=1 Tax=Gigaspora margarita TaxID=4874 RepID=A0A8H3XEE3_GIGMA|nr:NADP-binding protein [Gigaspora margarita]
MQIKDKVVILTGGANGFGAALARRLVSEGARVIIGDIDRKAGQELVTELNQNNKVNAIFIFCDVTNFDHLSQLFDTAQNTFGGVDIVCNNAGIGQENEFYDQTNRWIKIIDVNLNAVIKGTQLGIQYLKKRGGGVIINTASMSAFYPMSHSPIYSTSKRAVVGFTQSLRDLKDTDKIRVNAVAPSYFDSNLTQGLLKSKKHGQAAKNFGFVPIDDVIDAFIRIIQDDKLAGDTIAVTTRYKSKIISKSSL